MIIKIKIQEEISRKEQYEAHNLNTLVDTPKGMDLIINYVMLS